MALLSYLLESSRQTNTGSWARLSDSTDVIAVFDLERSDLLLIFLRPNLRVRLRSLPQVCKWDHILLSRSFCWHLRECGQMKKRGGICLYSFKNH